MMIINIRGTHGSGKSTVVRELLEEYAAEPDPGAKPNKPFGYQFSVPGLEQPVYAVGSYVQACGGCDGIQPYSDIWPRVERYAGWGHVIFEGALISTNYGTIGKASEKYGDGFVFAFLDTPLDVCLERIKSRRAAKGNLKPLDPYQTTWKHKGILSLYDRFRTERGRRTVLVPYTQPVATILDLLRSGEAEGL